MKSLLIIRNIVLERVSGNSDEVHLKKIKNNDLKLSSNDQIELKDGSTLILSACQ